MSAAWFAPGTGKRLDNAPLAISTTPQNGRVCPSE